MISLFRAIHLHAATRGDGLRPEFFGAVSKPLAPSTIADGKPPAPGVHSKDSPEPCRQTRHRVRKPVIL